MEAPSLAAPESPHSVNGLRALSLRSLRGMYRPDEGLFVFCVRGGRGAPAPEGLSPRYTAITLLGLHAEGEDAIGDVLHGADIGDVAGGLVDRAANEPNLGNVALTLWVARLVGHERAPAVLDRLRALDPAGGGHPTVEVAWALTALSVEPHEAVTDADLAGEISRRLRSSQYQASGLFSHWPAGVAGSGFRSHVACFADLVYPIQALSHYFAWSGDRAALDAAKRCGARMCATQGDDGQWWWHFDVRTGRCVEKYPVYAVHQDAMAPMALFALSDAGGADFTLPIRRGLDWLRHAPEIGGSLIDPSVDLIWRKVARHEPGKLTRGIQALASRFTPSLRVPGIDHVFRPGAVDRECRPYHLGWLLYAWAGRDAL